MAIVRSSLLTKIRGPIGNVSFSTQKGRIIAREKPTVVSNPQSPAQTAQREAMARVVAAWQRIGDDIRVGMTSYSEYGNPYSGFISENIDLAKLKTYNPADFNNQEMSGYVVSDGNLGTLLDESASATATTITVQIAMNSISEALKENDTMYLVVGETNSKGFEKSSVAVGTIDRGQLAKAYTFNVGTDYQGDDIEFAVFAVSADGEKSTRQTLVSLTV